MAGNVAETIFEKPRIHPPQEVSILIGREDSGKDELSLSEWAKVEKVRHLEEKDLETILRWTRDPETRRHLEPPPDLPEDWQNEKQVQTAIQKLKDYYDNLGEPQKITPLVAVNPLGETVGVLTVRWRGDPYVPPDRKIASIEKLIVDPNLQGHGIGTTLMATSIEYAFLTRGFKEVRAWIMTDKQAGNWIRNFHFLRKFGFQIVPNAPHWREYAQKRNIPGSRDRDALWFMLKPDWYEEQKKVNQDIKPCSIIDL